MIGAYVAGVAFTMPDTDGPRRGAVASTTYWGFILCEVLHDTEVTFKWKSAR